jgi:hypothetical protein
MWKRARVTEGSALTGEHPSISGPAKLISQLSKITSAGFPQAAIARMSNGNQTAWLAKHSIGALASAVAEYAELVAGWSWPCRLRQHLSRG